MIQGKFIVLEGGEGSGKSTQVKLLAERLRAHGVNAHVTREVGGAPLAEEIRKLWLADRDGDWDSLTELLLIFAARREHLVKTIRPKLGEGAWVICDRFQDSTLVYQGRAMGMPRADIQMLYQMIAGGFYPNLILFLDVPVAVVRQRMAGRVLDRYERQDDAFHESLRQGYLQEAAEERKHDPQRGIVINASGDIEAVHQSIWEAVQPLLEN